MVRGTMCPNHRPNERWEKEEAPTETIGAFKTLGNPKELIIFKQRNRV
jgi:hypothetical protein